MLKMRVAAKARLEYLTKRFARDEDGASLVEYSLLIGIITVAAIASIGTVGTWVSHAWSDLAAALP